MPVNAFEKISGETLYQRQQYEKGGVGRWYWDYRDRVVLRHIGQSPSLILDAGCGEGITLQKLRMLFPASGVFGVDIMPENVRICREHGLPAQRGDLSNLPFRDDSFDYCILSEVIEHIGSPGPVIDEIRRVLKPCGKLILVFPNDMIFRAVRILFLKFREAAYDPGHVKQWTPRSISELFRNHSFRTIYSCNIPGWFWGLSLHGIAVGEK